MRIRPRDFLGWTAAAPVLASSNGSSNTDKRQRLACNSWPFRGYFDTPQMSGYRNPQDPFLTQAEFPQFIADHFGNFATKSTAFALSQLRMLAPYASTICHSKDGIAEKGGFYQTTFSLSMKIMHDTGFRGLYSLEFEGLGNAPDGVRKLMNLTEEYLE